MLEARKENRQRTEHDEARITTIRLAFRPVTIKTTNSGASTSSTTVQLHTLAFQAELEPISGTSTIDRLDLEQWVLFGHLTGVEAMVHELNMQFEGRGVAPQFRRQYSFNPSAVNGTSTRPV